MDIPNEDPRKDRKNRNKEKNIGGSTPNEFELTTSVLVGELIGSHGQTEILSYIRNLHGTAEEKRVSMEGPRTETPISGIENFLLSDHPSHLTKIAKLEEQLEKSRRAVEILDQTDESGKSLYDFIPEEVKSELADQLKGLKEWKSIKETVENEISASCGEIWDDYKRAKAGTQEARRQTLETLILGPGAPLEEKKALNSVESEIADAGTLGELLGLEKTRLVVRALTASTKDYAEKSADAEKILGPDFELIREQVNHMENMLEQDWLASEPGEDIIKNTDIQEIICPALASKMDSKADPEGKRGDLVRISAAQQEVLESIYRTAQNKRDERETPRDRINRRVAFIMAATEFLELGKQAFLANTLKDIRTPGTKEKKGPDSKEKSEAVPPPLPTEVKKTLGEKIREKAVAAMKGTGKLPLKGVGAILKQWPQALFMGLGAAAMKRGKGMHELHYGSEDMEKHVQYVQEMLGEVNRG